MRAWELRWRCMYEVVRAPTERRARQLGAETLREWWAAGPEAYVEIRTRRRPEHDGGPEGCVVEARP